MLVSRAPRGLTPFGAYTYATKPTVNDFPQLPTSHLVVSTKILCLFRPPDWPLARPTATAALPQPTQPHGRRRSTQAAEHTLAKLRGALAEWKAS